MSNIWNKVRSIEIGVGRDGDGCLTLLSETLSDGSKAFSVEIRGIGDDTVVRLDCLNERRATDAYFAIGSAICTATGGVSFLNLLNWQERWG